MDNMHESQQTQHTDLVLQQELSENVQKTSYSEVEVAQSTEIISQNPAIQEQEMPNEKLETTQQPAPVEEPSKEEQNLHAEEESLELSDDFYDHLNKQEVVETLEKVVTNSDIVKIKPQVSLLKIRFLQLNKEDKEQQYQAFLAEGGSKEDYVYEPNDWEIRYNKAFDAYKSNKMRYAEELEQTKLDNLSKKTALLEELKVLVDSPETLKHIYDRFKEIQNTWKEIGVVPQANVGELWQNYHFYVEKFFDKIRINRELRDLDFKKNLEARLEICEKTEALLLEPSIARAFGLLQEYQQEWKEAGAVEETKWDELWNRFKTASDKIYQDHMEHYEQVKKQREANYQAKLAVCENLEKITNVKLESTGQINEISSTVAELFKTWKTLGPAPREVHDEVWERFRKGMEDFAVAKRQYFVQYNEKQINNYNLKVNLCIQAEAIALRKDFKTAMPELLVLQEEWKKIGSVSIKQSEPIWKRFRKACDDFFAAKKDYYDNIKAHKAKNLVKKEALIKQIAEFQFGESREDNLAALKNFQREWMEIGYIPFNEKDRLWGIFRSAIDAKFEELKSMYNMEDKTKYAQRVSEMVEKESGKAGKILAKEAGSLQDQIRQLTDEVNLWENNLSFFANSKNSDALREQFGKKIDAARQEIASLKEKLAVIMEKNGTLQGKSKKK